MVCLTPQLLNIAQDNPTKSLSVVPGIEQVHDKHYLEPTVGYSGGIFKAMRNQGASFKENFMLTLVFFKSNVLAGYQFCPWGIQGCCCECYSEHNTYTAF